MLAVLLGLAVCFAIVLFTLAFTCLSCRSCLKSSEKENQRRLSWFGLLVGFSGLGLSPITCGVIVLADPETDIEMTPGKGPGCLLGVAFMGGALINLMGVILVVVSCLHLCGVKSRCCGGTHSQVDANG